MKILDKLSSYLKRLALKKAELLHRRAVSSARRKVSNSQKALEDWKDFVEYRVFDSVQGDDIIPDKIHGQTLCIHFSEKILVEDLDGDTSYNQQALCSDQKGRWYELVGIPGLYADLHRINARKGSELLERYKAVELLASSQAQ